MLKFNNMSINFVENAHILQITVGHFHIIPSNESVRNSSKMNFDENIPIENASNFAYKLLSTYSSLANKYYTLF